MSKVAYQNLADAWDALVRQVRAGKSAPPREKWPTALPVHRIKQWPEVFQHRKPGKHVTEAHARELAKGAAQRDLDPVLVWWDGKYWACIDGHHRILAYRIPGPARDIPVEVFEGSPEQAIAQAAYRNTRDKLAMGPSEKQGAAWRLTNTTQLSKADVAQAAGASERLVA